nr:glycoside hydrolase family 5 subfamily 2 [Oxymirus cursor]
MKSSFLILVVVLGCSIDYGIALDTALETVTKHGKLSVDGIQLVDESGQPFQIKGMSMFWSVWMPQYWNRATVHAIRANCHSNLVRAAMAVDYEGYLTDPQTQMRMVETVIEAAIAEDIYVIADWHDWAGESHLQQAQGFFDQISKKYGHYPHLLYETFNEPLEISWSSVVKPYHEAVIKTIRANDPDNVILLGNPHYDQELDQVAADPIKGQKNIMYTLHFYPVDTKQWLRDRASNVLRQGIPLFVSEYGTCAGSGNGTVLPEETQLWYNWLDQNKMSYVNWAVSDKDESASVMRAGTPPEQTCADNYLTESGRIVVAQNKK